MWRKFPEIQPKEDGWYQCTIIYESYGDEYATYVMDLYWKSMLHKFVDNRRQDVFNTYDVYNYKNEKMITCNVVDRTDTVVAWKPMPNPIRIKGINYHDGIKSTIFDTLNLIQRRK